MGAPTGADRRDRAGLRPARDADLAAAGQGHPDRADVPLRPAAGRALPAVLAVRRRGDRRRRSGRRCRDRRARRAVLPRRRPRRRRGPAQLDRRPGLSAGLHRGADRATTGRDRRSCRRSSASAWSATRCACSTRRTPRWRRSTPTRRASPTGCARPAPRTSRRSAATSTRSASAYRLEPGLVRGLDYYTRTAFEFYVRGREGQQQAIGGGGRYDGLVELLGGRPTPGHRVRDRARSGRPGARGGRPRGRAGAGAGRRRRRRRPGRHGSRGWWSPRSCAPPGCDVRADLGRRKLGKQLEAAARDGAHFAVILGDELATGEVQLRDLPAGTQKLVARSDLARELARAHAAPPPRIRRDGRLRIVRWPNGSTSSTRRARTSRRR